MSVSAFIIFEELVMYSGQIKVGFRQLALKGYMQCYGDYQ
ncbi:hypothetical protein PPEP_a3639 [Pseudoalteromonas peptidolytica F12-50-A1]|uniref:Uncharacterized protein n=1 Tax=Pseudoalteromonas peptidolytica F12-50-A1 TaxID=1315280 RepID=A0A8I0MWD1_9GAMM|nr:hypothetical protein [Pseudoalteromonas peptidolytica F12-50-A1]